MEKVNLGCCESGIQEVTGRAVIIVPSSFFSVKKVDKQRDEQENEEKSQVEMLFPSYAHVTFSAVFII